jgi:hypothetical protein
MEAFGLLVMTKQAYGQALAMATMAGLAVGMAFGAVAVALWRLAFTATR